MKQKVSSAFPTISNDANLPKRSIFDKENDNERNVITSNVKYAVYPAYEKRGKARNGYIVINTPVIEIHKNQKNSKNNKVVKYFINMGEIFNVCIKGEPIQIKGECISLMDLSETYFIKPIDNEFALEDWYEYVLEKCRVLRSAKLGRSVFREEYFEVAWDVLITKKPKLRRDYSKFNNIDDLAAKHTSLEGRRRLCIHPSSVLLFKMAVNPAASVENPFDKDNFINLPLNVISSYGHQEKYFILRSGRFSEIGSGELWMFCGNGSYAKSIHDRIVFIVTRETDRRQAEGIVRQDWTSTSSTRSRKSRDRRENPQIPGSENVHRSDSNMRSRTGTDQTLESLIRKNSSATTIPFGSPSSNLSFKYGGIKDHRSETVSLAKPQDKNDTLSAKIKSNSGSFTCKKNSLAGLLPFRLGKLSSTNSPASSELHSLSSAIAPSNTSLSDKVHNSGSSTNVSIMMSRRLASTSSTARPSSSGILNLQLEKRLSGLSLNNSHYNYEDDYMTFDPKDGSQFNSSYYKAITTNSVLDGSRKSSATSFGKAIHSIVPSTSGTTSIIQSTLGTPKRQFSHGSLSINRKERNPFSSIENDDYVEMDEVVTTNDIFPMHEVRTYVSDSSESCWSPYSTEGLSNVPRAYSLGSKPKLLPPVLHAQRQRVGGKASPVFSRGSKNLSPLSLRPNSNITHVEQINKGNINFFNQKPHCSGINAQNIGSLQQSQNQRQSLKPKELKQQVSTKNVSLKTLPVKEGLSETDASKDDTTPTSDSRPGTSSSESIAGAAKYVLSFLPTKLGSGASVASASGVIQSSVDEIGDLRKRTHSVGSKSWIKPLRKTSVKRGNISNEVCARVDSSGGEFFSGLSDCRRNSALFNSVDKPTSEDHVEIDFGLDRNGSCPSIESPLTRSRNSSFGIQFPTSMRSALDLALSNRSYAARLENESKLSNFGKTKEGDNVSEDFMERKRNALQIKDHVTLLDKNDCVDITNLVYSICEKEELTRSETLQRIKKVGDDDDYVAMELASSPRNAGAVYVVSNSKMKMTNPVSAMRLISTIVESAHSSSSSNSDSESNSLNEQKLTFPLHASFAIGGDESSDGKGSPQREDNSSFKTNKKDSTPDHISPCSSLTNRSSGGSSGKTSKSSKTTSRQTIYDVENGVFIDSVTGAKKRLTLRSRQASGASERLKTLNNSFTEKSLNNGDYDIIVSLQNSKRPFSTSDTDFIFSPKSNDFLFNFESIATTSPERSKKQSTSSEDDKDHQTRRKSKAKLTDIHRSSTSIKMLHCEENQKKLSTSSIKSLTATGNLFNTFVNSTGKPAKRKNDKRHKAATTFGQLHSSNVESKPCDYAIIEPSIEARKK